MAPTESDRAPAINHRSPTPRAWAKPKPKSDFAMSFLRLWISGHSLLSRRTGHRPAQFDDHEMPMRVTDRVCVADDVVLLTLKPIDAGTRVPAWTPGSHIDVKLPSGRVRQYSLVGDPADLEAYSIAVRRIADGAGGSVEIHDDVEIGTNVSVRTPRAAFPFADPRYARASITEVLFIAGGIGITALLPMVVMAHNEGLNWRLVYFGRNRRRMPFLDELDDLDRNRVHVVATEDLGRPDAQALLADVGTGTSVYYCGPPALIDPLREAFSASGAVGLNFERFSAPPVEDGRQFEITLARSGRTVTVPATQSALAAIRNSLPYVPHSCQQGFCGTCRVSVIAGEVEHRGHSRFLDAPDTMLICTDRCRGGEQITVDL